MWTSYLLLRCTLVGKRIFWQSSVFLKVFHELITLFRFNSICSFPVSVYKDHNREHHIVDFEYCTPLNNIENRILKLDNQIIHLCRSGYDYEDQFYDDGRLKTFKSERKYNFYARCLPQFQDTWSEWSRKWYKNYFPKKIQIKF